MSKYVLKHGTFYSADPNELMHYKYIKREKKNGRWVYYYQSELDSVSKSTATLKDSHSITSTAKANESVNAGLKVKSPAAYAKKGNDKMEIWRKNSQSAISTRKGSESLSNNPNAKTALSAIRKTSDRTVAPSVKKNAQTAKQGTNKYAPAKQGTKKYETAKQATKKYETAKVSILSATAKRKGSDKVSKLLYTMPTRKKK